MNPKFASFRPWPVLAGGTAIVGGAAVAIWMLGARPGGKAPPPALPQPLAALRPAPPAPGVPTALRSDLREILGRVATTRPGRRLELLRACGTDLTPPECEALLAALAGAPAPATDPGWHAEYFHEIALVLRRQPAVRERFARVLATVAADGARDETVRDYALQHLRQVWELAADQPQLRAAVVETFRSVALRDPLLAPSALLSLHLLGLDPAAGSAGRPAAIATPDIEPAVIAALESPPDPASVRMRLSSLRVAGERGMHRALPAIRRIAGDGAAEHALARMAAIAALGTFTDPADRPLLETLENSRDPRIAGAARRALTRLR